MAIVREILKALAIVPIKPQQQFDLQQTELLQFKMTEAEQYHQLATRAIARRKVTNLSQ